MIGEVLALIGAALTLLAAIGVVRFPDALARMHALTKASTLGFLFVAVGAALTLGSVNDVTTVLLAAGLQYFTLPVAANLIARSAYWSHGMPRGPDTIDELHEAIERAARSERDRS